MRHTIVGSSTIAITVLAAAFAAGLAAPRSARAYDERGPEPTAAYPSLDAVRDSIGVMVGRAVEEISPPHRRGKVDLAWSKGAGASGAGGAASPTGASAAGADTMIQVSRAPAKFKYWYAPGSATGWEYRIIIRDRSEDPMMKLEYALAAAGWSPDHGYAADGPDGSVMGFVAKGYFCMVESRWEPGSDSEEATEVDPGCEVTVTCVPRRADDVPKY